MKKFKSLKPEIYLDAALRIDDRSDVLACNAIYHACGHDDLETEEHLNAFEYYFKPETHHFSNQWFDSTKDDYNQMLRITALLIMATIAESEDT